MEPGAPGLPLRPRGGSRWPTWFFTLPRFGIDTARTRSATGDRRVRRRAQARWVLAVLVAAGALLLTRSSKAQQPTFHLDRLEVPGAPDDGVVLFRPATNEHPIVYAQLGLGFSLNPLRTSDITKNAVSGTPANIITTQFSTYMSGGFELFDRLTLGFTLPIAWEEAGHYPQYNTALGTSNAFSSFNTTGPAVGDMRFDARWVLARSDDRSWAIGGQLGVFVPTGSTTNFGGDGPGLEALPMVTAEWSPRHFLTLVANTGVAFRQDNFINDPAGRNGPRDGIGIGDEWRWALSANPTPH